MKRINSKKLLVTAIAAASLGLANVASAQEDQAQDRTNETAGTIDQATFETEAVVNPTGSEPGAIERETTQETEQNLQAAATETEGELDAPAEQTEMTAEEIEREAERNLNAAANEYGEAAEELNNETERLLERQSDAEGAMNTASENAESSYQNLTREYQDFLGDEAEPLISSLRSGEDLQYEKDGESMTIENKVGETQDSRDIHYALALAEAELGDNAELNEIANFIQGDQGVLMKRADGQDWGQIYSEYGYEMDQLIDANLRNSQASTETSASSETTVRETPDSVPADVDEDRDIAQADDAGIPDNWENDADAVEEAAEDTDSPREIADRGELPRNQ